MRDVREAIHMKIKQNGAVVKTISATATNCVSLYELRGIH